MTGDSFQGPYCMGDLYICSFQGRCSYDDDDDDGDDDDDTHECPDYFPDELKLAFSPKLGERGKKRCSTLEKVASVMQFRNGVCHGGKLWWGGMTTHMMLPLLLKNQGRPELD